jgi:hypothetical protein
VIEVKDRIPTYPGRIKLIPVPGQANTYDMVRADEPIEPGTPINRALFQMFIDEVNAIRQQVDDKLFELSQRVPVGNLANGSLIGLYENGVLVTYIKVRDGYRASLNSSEKTNPLVVRLNSVAMMPKFAADQSTAYDGSALDLWLNNEFFSTLDAATQGVMPTTYLQAPDKNDDIQYYNKKVFVLSLADYGLEQPHSLYYSFGYDVGYFSSGTHRVANYEGTPSAQHTRDSSNMLKQTAVILADGSVASVATTTVAGVRPAFTLPPTFEVTAGVPSTENVMATAEVI